MKALTFKYTKSKSQEYYGCTIVSLHIDGVKVAKSKGCGIDLRGLCLAQWLQETYSKQITEYMYKNKQSFYGVNYSNYSDLPSSSTDGTIQINGGCGASSMQKIIEHVLNCKMVYVDGDSKFNCYVLLSQDEQKR